MYARPAQVDDKSSSKPCTRTIMSPYINLGRIQCPNAYPKPIECYLSSEWGVVAWCGYAPIGCIYIYAALYRCARLCGRIAATMRCRPRLREVLVSSCGTMRSSLQQKKITYIAYRLLCHSLYTLCCSARQVWCSYRSGCYRAVWPRLHSKADAEGLYANIAVS